LQHRSALTTAKDKFAMAAKPLPDQDTLRQLLDYDPETGLLYWRTRSVDMFADAASGSSGFVTTEKRASTWNARFAGRPAFTSRFSGGYHHGAILGQTYMAHRVIWKWAHGFDPDCVDHINGDKGDNRLANLRSIPRAMNARNMPQQSNNTSGQTGVHFCNFTGRWRAEIVVSGRNIRLGRFANFSDAVTARRAAERKFGFHENHGR
jgi:hypothetical protein